MKVGIEGDVECFFTFECKGDKARRGAPIGFVWLVAMPIDICGSQEAFVAQDGMSFAKGDELGDKVPKRLIGLKLIPIEPVDPGKPVGPIDPVKPVAPVTPLFKPVAPVFDRK